MKKSRDESFARYGIDYRAADSHAEAEDLMQVLTALEGCVGVVRVVDRQRQGINFTGTVDELREAITASAEYHIAELFIKECPDAAS